VQSSKGNAGRQAALSLRNITFFEKYHLGLSTDIRGFCVKMPHRCPNWFSFVFFVSFFSEFVLTNATYFRKLDENR
jgi:hypothetical protein